MQDIKDYIAKYVQLLPLNSSISLPEAENRASQFLGVMAQITEYRHLLSEEKIKFSTVQSATFSEELSKFEGTTITAAKIKAEASASYISAREDLERIENDLAYLKAYYDIFLNGHLYYRQISKGESF